MLGRRLEGFTGRNNVEKVWTRAEREVQMKDKAKKSLINALYKIQMGLISEALSGTSKKEKCWRSVRDLRMKIDKLEVMEISGVLMLTIKLEEDFDRLVKASEDEFVNQMEVIDNVILPLIMEEEFDPDKRFEFR